MKKKLVGLICVFVFVFSSVSYGNVEKSAIGGVQLYYIERFEGYEKSTLTYGDNNDLVSNVQEFLVEKNYLESEKDIDGSYGPKTRIAVVNYQGDRFDTVQDYGVCDVGTYISMGFSVLDFKKLGKVVSEGTGTIRYVSNDETMGDRGRLYIPKTGNSVALNGTRYWSGNSDYSQYLTDIYDSACYFDDLNVVAEHKDQKFEHLESLDIGDIIYIVDPYGNTTNYECVDRGYGINDGYAVWDQYGVDVCNNYNDLLTLYTCTYDWVHVFIVKFAVVG